MYFTTLNVRWFLSIYYVHQSTFATHVDAITEFMNTFTLKYDECGLCRLHATQDVVTCADIIKQLIYHINGKR